MSNIYTVDEFKKRVEDKMDRAMWLYERTHLMDHIRDYVDCRKQLKQLNRINDPITDILL